MTDTNDTVTIPTGAIDFRTLPRDPSTSPVRAYQDEDCTILAHDGDPVAALRSDCGAVIARFGSHRDRPILNKSWAPWVDGVEWK